MALDNSGAVALAGSNIVNEADSQLGVSDDDDPYDNYVGIGDADRERGETRARDRYSVGPLAIGVTQRH